jgi:ferric-dicitrate binding protein FerR (iron transport regulator)
MNIDDLVDQATQAMRDRDVDQSVVDAAAARVSARIATPVAAPARAVAHIEGCEDILALLDSYISGDLTEARRLLLEDHTRECIPCRKALKAARTGAVPQRASVPTSKAAPRLRRTAPVRWAIAAGLVAAFGVLPATQLLGPFGSFEAVVEAADGPIYEVDRASTRGLSVGDAFEAGDRIRTARNAGAVIKLEDGTRVELRERSELSFSRSGKATTIRLDRGDIIVEAAGDTVYVATRSGLVETGSSTIAVTSGTKGTRVSTVRGSARVDSAGVERVVGAGEQFASSAAIEPVPVAREVAWSRDADKHAKALAELAALRREVDATLLGSESRTSTRLLDLAPASTVLYVAMPNLSDELANANRLVQDRINQNPALAEWWQQERGASNRAGVNKAIETVRELGAFLGPELVVAISRDASGAPGAPVVLAEVKDAAGFRSSLESHVASLAKASDAAGLRIVEDAAAIDNGSALSVLIRGDLVAVSPHGDALRSVASVAGTPETNAFRATPFYTRLATEYQAGVGFLVAADLKTIVGHELSKEKGLDQLGVADLQYFIVRQSTVGGRSSARAVLTFDEQRRGLASWLAAPGPMGALQYISPDANALAAFVVKDPAALVDDLFAFIGTSDPEALEALRRFESENGVSVRDDFAAPLGGEFAFAVDGPVLPTPSWKMIFEVDDPARLQASLEHAVEIVNRHLAAEGKPGITLNRTDSDNRACYAITSVAGRPEVHYTFVDGYLLVGPSKALLDRAISYRESGYTILSSERFRAALPEDGQANFSALVYHDLGRLISGVAENLPTDKADAETRKAIGALAADGLPTLAYAYAYEDRIEFATGGDGGAFGLSPSMLLGLPGSGGLGGLLDNAIKVN